MRSRLAAMASRLGLGQRRRRQERPQRHLGVLGHQGRPHQVDLGPRPGAAWPVRRPSTGGSGSAAARSVGGGSASVPLRWWRSDGRTMMPASWISNSVSHSPPAGNPRGYRDRTGRSPAAARRLAGPDRPRGGFPGHRQPAHAHRQHGAGHPGRVPAWDRRGPAPDRSAWASVVVFERGGKLVAHRLLFALGFGPGTLYLEKGDWNATGGLVRRREVRGVVTGWRSAQSPDPAPGGRCPARGERRSSASCVRSRPGCGAAGAASPATARSNPGRPAGTGPPR